MTNFDTTRDLVVRVAIDISKHRHDILIATPEKKRRQRMTTRNIKEDFERFRASDDHIGSYPAALK